MRGHFDWLWSTWVGFGLQWLSLVDFGRLWVALVGSGWLRLSALAGSGGLWLPLIGFDCLWLTLVGLGWVVAVSRLGREWVMSGPWLGHSTMGHLMAMHDRVMSG